MDDNIYTQKGLENTLDKIETKIDSISVTLALNTKSLEEHMYRTELNEKAIEKISDSLKPVQKHVDEVQWGLKILGALFTGIITVGGLVAAIIQIIKKIG